MTTPRSLLLTTAATGLLLLCGCGTTHRNFGSVPAPAGIAGCDLGPATTEIPTAGTGRMLIRSATLKLDVADPAAAAARVEQAVRSAEGRVEKRTDEEDLVVLKLRVPTARLDSVTAGLETLGKVTFRQSESRDVTSEYVDTAARLKNAIALRDRLRELLAKTAAIAEVLEIEKELARVQGEIDAFEARRAAMKDEVDLADINCELRRQEREPIPGPVTVIFKGVGWVLKKLFVLRD